MDALWGTLLLGTCVGSFYALLASGFNLVVTSSGVIDFARGQLVLVGSLVTYSLELTYGVAPIPALLGALVASALVGTLGYLVAVAPLRSGDRSLGWLASTLGFGLAVGSILTIVYRSSNPHVAALIPGTGFSVGGDPFSWDEVLIIPIALIAITTLWLVSQRTMMGRSLRAVAEDRDAASMRGINVRAYALGGFAVAGVLAGLAGYVFPSVENISIPFAFTLTINGFVATVVGGSGSIWGALAGGELVGIIEALGTRYVSQSAHHLFGLAVLLVVLLIRPNGLVASRQLRRA